MAGLRVFSQGACIILGGGGSTSIMPPATPPPGTDQSPVDRSLGLPQLYKMVVSYDGILKPDMGVKANDLDQSTLP
jgi:hypothetical protein